MTIGWIDGTAGASGDMLLGAVVDAGVGLDVVRESIDRLRLGIGLRSEPVTRAGLGATKVHVDIAETDTLRHLPEIIELLQVLDEPVRARAVATFRRLADAEASVHRTAVDAVHFHEVGALDSIADVVGVCAGLVRLGIDELHCSTLSLGSGTTRGAHGPIPVPAPAVLAVLRGIAPVTAGPAAHEATTPTGAALLAEWVQHWGPMPAMTVDTIGAGAGTRDSDVVANVCRLVTGERRDLDDDDLDETEEGDTVDRSDQTMIQIDANVDDLDPRMWPGAIAAVMAGGAVDAWVTPIIMKKGRPAHTFSALCVESRVDAVCAAIFRETTTIGLRRHRVERETLDRVDSVVHVSGQEIRAKTALRDGEVVNRSLEWDDVVAAARHLGRPPKRVVAEAMALLDTIASGELDHLPT